MMWTYTVLLLILGSVWMSYAEESIFDDSYDDYFASKNATDCNELDTKPVGKYSFNMKNGSVTCVWTILPNATNMTSLYIMLQKMILDPGDVVTVQVHNSSEVLFGPFHAQTDSILLVSAEKAVDVILKTSPTIVQRHLAASYQSRSCTFIIDDDIPTVTQPLFPKNFTEQVTCSYVYNDKSLPNITFAFHFEKFHMEKSSVSIEGMEGIAAQTFQGTDLPSDFLSGANEVHINMNMNVASTDDKFVLRKWDVYKGCSSYIEIGIAIPLKSPPPLQLTDGNIPIQCFWHLKSVQGKEALQIQFHNVSFTNSYDVLSVIDGNKSGDAPVLQVTESSKDAALDTVLLSSATDLIVIFKPVSFVSQFSATVSATDGHRLKNNGTLTGRPNANLPNGTIFLLEVDSGKTVVLNFKSAAIVAPTILNIYEDFGTNSHEIASLRTNLWYPIISRTSKMMIKAINFQSGSFEADFREAEQGCMHMSRGVGDNYILSGNCATSCGWIISPITSNSHLLLNLQYIDLRENDKIEVYRLDDKKTLIASIDHALSSYPQLSLSAADGAYVNVTRGTCNATEAEKIALVAYSNYVPDCSKNFTLNPSDVISLTSMNYPNSYPLYMDCEYHITKSPSPLVFHLAFHHLNLAAGHYINVTQISKNGTTSVVINSNNPMPDDFFFNGDIIVRFNSNKTSVNLSSVYGFDISVSLPSCGGVFDKTSGILNTEDNKTECVWKVTVPPTGSDGSVNTIMFNITKKDKTDNYDLEIHDGPSAHDASVPNITAVNNWSRYNNLLFVYERHNNSEPSGQLSIAYEIKNCPKEMLCKNHICMHPNWKCNEVDDCGDASDEFNCASAPVPPTDSTKVLGVTSTTLAICIIVFFVLGIAITLLVPWAYEKYKGRYQRFQDISVID